MRAVAVLGDGAGLAEAAALAGLGEREAAAAADLLAALEILAAAERLEFAHPIVREAVYADIGPRERAEQHARAAAILAARGAPDERVAAQIVAAPSRPPTPSGSALLRRVAAEALARGAPVAARAWLRRALAEPPPADGARPRCCWRWAPPSCGWARRRPWTTCPRRSTLQPSRRCWRRRPVSSRTR